MKATSTEKAKSSKPVLKVKALPPRRDPKGGTTTRRGGGDCDEFGCGGNHNEVLVSDPDV